MACRSLILGMLATFLGASVQAAPLPRYGSFVFSSLCSHPRSGAMIGSRLTVVRLDHDDVVYYEWSEAWEPGRVALPGQKRPSPASFGTNVAHGLQGASAVMVRIESPGRMTAKFGAYTRALSGTLAGQISEEGFALSGFEAPIWIPRQRDLSAKIPVCDARPPKFTIK